MGENVKNQHYIPRCVLKHFSNEKEQVYEALVEKRKHYITNYKNSMAERYTYEHQYLEMNFLENQFTELENIYSPAIDNILKLLKACDEVDTHIVDIKKCVDEILNIMIIFYYRSGALLHEFSFQTKIKDYRITLLLENILNSDYIRKLSNVISEYYSFAIVKSVNEELLLSDQYISTAALSIKSRFANLSNRHMGLKDVILLIPISSCYYIVYYHGKKPDYLKNDKINLLDNFQINELNEIIINNSYVKCIAKSDKALLESLMSFEFRSPSATYMSYSTGALSGATLKKEIFFYKSDNAIWEEFTSHDWMKHSDVKRNDKCACGSGRKFKNCCRDIFNGSKRIMDDIVYFQDTGDFAKVFSNPHGIAERPIGEFFS